MAASREMRLVMLAGARWVAAFIVLFAVAVVVMPLAGEAQQATSLARVGFLMPFPPSDPRVPRFLQAFRQGLHELGYVEGQNIAIEFRSAEGKYDRLSALAAELVRLKVNVIVTVASPATQAAKQATETIPIVMVNIADPVASGFVASLARPAGNITGSSLMLPEMVAKQLELLKEVLPKVPRVACLGNPTNPNYAAGLPHAQDAARALGVRLQPVEIRNSTDIDSAFAAMARDRAGALIVFTDAVTLDYRTRLADHAIRRRLPTVSGVSEFAEAGGLLAYGPRLTDGYRRAASYVDKILKGAKAADLPVEQPTTFELVVNLKTAKVLGLTIPHSVLQRADQVIQ